MFGLFSRGEDFLEIKPQQSLSISSTITNLNSVNVIFLGYSTTWYLMKTPIIRTFCWFPTNDLIICISVQKIQLVSWHSMSIALLLSLAGQPDNGVEEYQTIVNASNGINNVASATILNSKEVEADNRLREMYAVHTLSFWN